MGNEMVLITGASAGIGRELALRFAEDGSDLVLVARREDRLEELGEFCRANHGSRVEILARDLSAPRAGWALADDLAERGLSIDVLVNNAGFGLNGPVLELDLERQLHMIQLNVTTLTELTGRLLPAMVDRGRGGVLNVASTAGFQPGPRMAIYYATKAYVLSFSEALGEELRGTPIRVSCLCPGPTATEFTQAAEMDDPLLFRLTSASAARVARAGLRGFRRGRPLVVPGLSNKLGTLAVRLVPRALVRRVVKRLQ